MRIHWNLEVFYLDHVKKIFVQSYTVSFCVCLYQMVAFVMIAVAAYGKFVAVIETVTVMSGIVVCGVILLVISIIGLIGSVHHHQVLLFFVSLQLCHCKHSLYLSDVQQSVTGRSRLLDPVSGTHCRRR